MPRWFVALVLAVVLPSSPLLADVCAQGCAAHASHQHAGKPAGAGDNGIRSTQNDGSHHCSERATEFSMAPAGDGCRHSTAEASDARYQDLRHSPVKAIAIVAAVLPRIAPTATVSIERDRLSPQAIARSISQLRI
jgi:hypothetical protein